MPFLRGTNLVVTSALIAAAAVMLPASLVLAGLRTTTVAPARAETRSQAETVSSDWGMAITPEGQMEIRYKGVSVATTGFTFWGAKWAWTGSRMQLEPHGTNQWSLTGGIPNLKAKFSGSVRETAPNQLRIDLVLDADQEIPELIGGGWEWNFKLDSPVFGGQAAAPELLPNNQGWVWQVGGGENVSFRFKEATAKVYFEQNRKNTVRTFLISDRLPSGTRAFHITLEIPQGGQRNLDPSERYDPEQPSRWFKDALDQHLSPVDLSFLNRDDRPAGKHGPIHADGDQMVHADGTPARFWGANLTAYALFSTPRDEIRTQAKRMAQLGYNLMRIHHHDSDWVNPNIFGNKAKATRQLDPKSLDTLDWWIKCLKDEGIYVWLDMEVGRMIIPADHLTDGSEDIARNKGSMKGLMYFNPGLQTLMKDFQSRYLGHENKYTGLTYRDDPAVVGVLITNENDLTQHQGNMMLPDHKFMAHNARWTRGYQAFAKKNGLSASEVFKTWQPGPSKLYLAEAEHEFNAQMISDLREHGVKAPVATTNFWGADPLFCLPSLTDGDWIDVHSYGVAEELSRNPHVEGNFLSWIAMGQVYGKPLSITEWNAEFPNPDRFTTPMYLASVAALQGWDAPMLFAYSQGTFGRNPGLDKWSTYYDPALTAMMPAAALLYRRGDVAPAKKTYCLMPDSKTLFGRELTPKTSAAIRSLTELSKLTIGIPPTRELPWLKPSQPGGDTIVITDPDQDFIPEGQNFVQSDTGELTRDWVKGIQTIDTPKTQAVGGWIGGEQLRTRDASFTSKTKKAAVALSSIDNQPLGVSRFILVTAAARAVPTGGNRTPFLSEPVHCRIRLKSTVDDLELMALAPDRHVLDRVPLKREGDSMTFDVPTTHGTHWYVIKPRKANDASAPAR